MDCALCGLPAPASPYRGDGRVFCCVGCREVHRRFGDRILDGRRAAPAGTREDAADGAEAFLRIDGMHCSSCELLFAHLAGRIDGVRSIRASYATAAARVIYDPDRIAAADLPRLLSVSGYRVSLRKGERGSADQVRALFRVVTATSLASVVMMLYLAFYYPTHLGLVDAADLAPVAWLAFGAAPLAMLVLTTIMVAVVGLPILRGAWIGLKVGVLNMDNLIAIAVLAAWGYSVMRYFQGSQDLYFDVTAMILTVVTLGRYFERGARAAAASELEKLLDAFSPLARVRRDGRVTLVALDKLKPGEILLVEPSEAIAVDGVIVKGEAAVDESLMTGEPFPRALGPGDPVSGGAVVIEGRIEYRAGRTLESRIDALARILWNVQSAGSGIGGLADRLARGFVPLVLLLAAAAAIWTYSGGGTLAAAMQIGLATLIVSCPCTFGLAIPLASAAGIGAALRRGVIFTGPGIFDKPGRYRTVVFDKTGTLSSGDMAVEQVIGPPETLRFAAAAERLSGHPIARAIARLDGSLKADGGEVQPGRGVTARVGGRLVAVGGASLFRTLGWPIPAELADPNPPPGEAGDRAWANGVVSYVGWDGRAMGAILTRDRNRPEWREAIAAIRGDSRLVLLSGAENTAGFEQEFDETFRAAPPGAKAAIVRHLLGDGPLAMIGDGSNDAPALAEADLGIAFGAPTALAAEAADVVIPGGDLGKIELTLAILKDTRRRIRQNLGWALLYNATAIPLALSGYLNPLFAALAMSLSSALVVWNSSRRIGPAPMAGEGARPGGRGRRLDPAALEPAPR